MILGNFYRAADPTGRGGQGRPGGSFTVIPNVTQGDRMAGLMIATAAELPEQDRKAYPGWTD